ncbi:MAG: 16S rRNA (cytosine(1402)-N(4))-methyltransferase, partial [Deltaproteobacteria bacterium]|nr:16S rRNA (cytosine(1402)-N(4))-methyltransferase [Deltaproteobacteria bacterium]
MEIFSGKKSGGGVDIDGTGEYVRKAQPQPQSKAVQSAVHIPVLLKEAMDALNIRRGNVYVDGTLGGGGFSEAILKKLDGEGFLIGIDRDFSAVKNVSSKFETEFNTKNFK